MGAQMQRGAYSRVCGASTAFRPVAVEVGGAERGAPMSPGTYRRVCGAATPKGAAQRGCSATGSTPRATGAPAALGYAGAGPAQGVTGFPSHVRVTRRQTQRAASDGTLFYDSHFHATASSSRTIPLIVSNPACQKLSDRISTPKSFSKASGDRDPPAARSARYRGTNDSP